jgi:hypothetical protein
MTEPKRREPFGIRSEAFPAWLSLAHALARMSDDGRRPVCESHPEDWGNDAPAATRREAAEACSWCSAVGPCGRFADANRERFGVWAEVDRAARPKTKQVTAA